MSFVPKTQPFSGKINAVTLGVGDKAVVIGGQNVLSFYTFDAAIENVADTPVIIPVNATSLVFASANVTPAIAPVSSTKASFNPNTIAPI